MLLKRRLLIHFVKSFHQDCPWDSCHHVKPSGFSYSCAGQSRSQCVWRGAVANFSQHVANGHFISLILVFKDVYFGIHCGPSIQAVNFIQSLGVQPQTRRSVPGLQRRAAVLHFMSRIHNSATTNAYCVLDLTGDRRDFQRFSSSFWFFFFSKLFLCFKFHMREREKRERDLQQSLVLQ